MPAFEPSHPFVPALGLRSAHLQTVLSFLARSKKVPATVHRERWQTADRDFVDVDVLPGPAEAPTVVLLHGLEGSSRSGYLAVLLRLLHARGWSAYALNFRGCSGEPNRLARSYSSGDTVDLADLVGRLQARGHSGPRYAIGFSLGGNVLLKYLSEAVTPGLDAAVAVSVPFDLQGCARLLDASRGLASVYRRHFLPSLKAKALQKAKAHPADFDVPRLRAAQGIEAFDDAVTCRLYGLPSAAAYYAWAASGPKLGAVRTPTLLLSASDDPLAPASMLPPEAFTNPALWVHLTAHGGHVGFVEGSLLRPRYWVEPTALEFLSARR